MGWQFLQGLQASVFLAVPKDNNIYIIGCESQVTWQTDIHSRALYGIIFICQSSKSHLKNKHLE